MQKVEDGRVHFSYYDGPPSNNPEEGCMPVSLVHESDLIPPANTKPQETCGRGDAGLETYYYWRERRLPK